MWTLKWYFPDNAIPTFDTFLRQTNDARLPSCTSGT